LLNFPNCPSSQPLFDLFKRLFLKNLKKNTKIKTVTKIKENKEKGRGERDRERFAQPPPRDDAIRPEVEDEKEEI